MCVTMFFLTLNMEHIMNVLFVAVNIFLTDKIKAPIRCWKGLDKYLVILLICVLALSSYITHCC